MILPRNEKLFVYQILYQARVTRETAALIDNTFTNAINKQTTSGILITDIYTISI